MTDDFCDPRHCLPSGDLKPRRPLPQIKASDLLAGLRLEEHSGRWMYGGPLNGWPAMVNLELCMMSMNPPCIVHAVVTLWYCFLSFSLVLNKVDSPSSPFLR